MLLLYNHKNKITRSVRNRARHEVFYSHKINRYFERSREHERRIIVIIASQNARITNEVQRRVLEKYVTEQYGYTAKYFVARIKLHGASATKKNKKSPGN